MPDTPITQSNNVVNLFDYIALCPECDNETFRMFTESPYVASDGEKEVKIIGTECDRCKSRRNWI